ALGDSNISVKVAAAAALGKLGKPAGVPCLEAARARDGSSALRAQIDKSLSQLGGGGGGAIAAGTKYYVAIAITNKTKRPTAEIEGIVRSAMQAKLQSVSGFAVAPKSESPSQGGQIVKSKRLKGFYLLATVEAPVYAGGSLTQVVRLSMFTYPDKALRGETPVKLTQSDTPSKDVESENVLMKMCSENAVANFQKVINTL
ncbi:MAG TPA: hypothetical protein VHB21_09775, partial [Minicystis sp.]|nr:hypothetical protein [Minicystis sp.]